MELRDRLYLHDEIPDDAARRRRRRRTIRPAVGLRRVRVPHGRRRRRSTARCPSRIVRDQRPLQLPARRASSTSSTAGSGKQAVSTTMAFTRAAAEPGPRREVRHPGRADHPRRGPHLRHGRAVQGVRDLRRRRASSTSRSTTTCCSPTRESQDGQILEEGITEAGAMASFTAAGTAYANRGVPMVPFFIFYSMFGFQRVGDLIWAAADCPGPRLPARRHRRAHDAARRGPPAPGRPQPAAGVHRPRRARPTTRRSPTRWRRSSRTGIAAHVRRRRRQSEDVFYYLTLYNENYAMPAAPEGVDRRRHPRGPLPWAAPERARHTRPRSCSRDGAGRGPRGAGRAGRALRRRRRAVAAPPSYKPLREEALTAERWNRLHPDAEPARPVRHRAARRTRRADRGRHRLHAGACPTRSPAGCPGPFVPLGTDGFGRSDTREALRRFFEIDTAHVVVAVLSSLAEAGTSDRSRPRPSRATASTPTPRIPPTSTPAPVTRSTPRPPPAAASTTLRATEAAARLRLPCHDGNAAHHRRRRRRPAARGPIRWRCCSGCCSTSRCRWSGRSGRRHA